MLTYIANLFSLVLYGTNFDYSLSDFSIGFEKVGTYLLNALNGFGGGTADITATLDFVPIVPMICAIVVTLAFAFGFVRLLMRIFSLAR